MLVNIGLFLMLLFANVFPKKMVGLTSVFNPRYNIALDAIKTSAFYYMPVRQSHRHTVSQWYEMSKQNYINNKSKLFLSNQQSDIYLKQNEFIKDKKIISISPGGLKGFYLMGVVTFIKENYDLDPFIFSGASAGAWSSLFMSFKREPIEVAANIIDESIKKAASISEIEHMMKYKILKTYKTEDFDLRRLFIGITTLNNFKVNTNIYSDFDDLEDALNCCIASSHIPLITGGFTNKYHNVYAFDGGFSKYPYLNTTKPVLHITPSMWNSKNKLKDDLFSYTTLFSKDKYDFMDLFDNGYNDAKANKDYLNSIFLEQQ